MTGKGGSQKLWLGPQWVQGITASLGASAGAPGAVALLPPPRRYAFGGEAAPGPRPSPAPSSCLPWCCREPLARAFCPSSPLECVCACGRHTSSTALLGTSQEVRQEHQAYQGLGLCQGKDREEGALGAPLRSLPGPLPRALPQWASAGTCEPGRAWGMALETWVVGAEAQAGILGILSILACGEV